MQTHIIMHPGDNKDAKLNQMYTRSKLMMTTRFKTTSDETGQPRTIAVCDACGEETGKLDVEILKYTETRMIGYKTIEITLHMYFVCRRCKNDKKIEEIKTLIANRQTERN